MFVKYLQQVLAMLPDANTYQGNLFKHTVNELNYQFVFEKLEIDNKLEWELISEYKI